MPLVGNPKSVVCEKFHAKCIPDGSHRLRVFMYANEKRTPARTTFERENAVICGFCRWASPNTTAIRRVAGRNVSAWISDWNA